MKKLNAKQYARLLHQLTDHKPKSELAGMIKGFIGLLSRRHQLNLKDRIIQEYDQLIQEQTGQFHARVTTAQKLNAGAKKDITASLKEAFGYEVDVEELIDPSIIGGFTVQVKDAVIDASVRRQLQSLKHNMINS